MTRPAPDREMSAEEFRASLKRLGFPSPYAAAAALGVTPTQAFRLAENEASKHHSKITRTMRLLLLMYERHGVPKDFLTP